MKIYLAIAAFLLLTLPFITSVPYLDGNIDLVKTYDYYSGGIVELAGKWGSVHPPFKLFVTSTFFHVLGLHAWTYNVVGILFGSLGVVATYFLAKTLFGVRTAGIAALLMATSPLYVATGIFSLIDFIVAVLVIVSLWMLAVKKYLLFAIVAVCIVLTKETALLLPVSVIAGEVLYVLVVRRGWWHSLRVLAGASLACISYVLWTRYLQSLGQRPWSDWIFAETADKGAAYTVIHNMLSGAFINQYARENWLHLFVLNYMWVFTGLAIVGAVYGLMKKERLRILIMYSFFAVLYSLLVLTFQTYTIPRYVLPVVPYIILLASKGIDTLAGHKKIVQYVVFGTLSVIVGLSLFTSSDPVSRFLWGDMTWMGQSLYNLRDHLSGNDGITYNMQYFYIVKQRSRAIYQAQAKGRSVVSNDCSLIFADPNNESKMLHILSFDRIPEAKWCVSP